jgi:hypothetical protein
MSAETLINELMHNANASGNKPLEQRLADTTVWFYKNKDRIPRDNLAGRQAFLEKAFWIALEINALLLERVHELEGMKPGASLWMPRGVTVNGDVRKFG